MTQTTTARGQLTKFYHRSLKNVLTALIIAVLACMMTPAHHTASAEYFSSVDALQKLGNIELGLVTAFRDYLETQQRELEIYTKFIEQVKLQHSIAFEDTEDYLGNPINAFTLIKRLVTDWNHLHGFIREATASNLLRTALDALDEKQPTPDLVELKGAVKGLIRLQKVYDFRAHDLASGEINGTQYGTELSWHDCFEIGAILFDQKELIFAMNWLLIALDKLEEIEDAKKDAIARKFEIETLEYLALTNYELGNSDKAVEYIDVLLELAPHHHTEDLRNYILNTEPKTPPAQKKPWAWYKNYTRLCQGKQLPERKFHKLKCKLETRNRPYLILAPLKIEQLNLDPEVNVYHGILSDIQIERIIKQAEANMERSQVRGGKSSEVRISQQAWLDYKSPTMKSVFNWVSYVTGFNVSNSEEMQMANYGIGGHYEPHTDSFGPGGFNNSRWIGDRIATNMFYVMSWDTTKLSDVEQGGFTVFPELNIYSRPIKGSLIVWHNLFRSLEPDERTLHSGCPVVKGSKRIGNVWVHAGYQEFRRPCALENDALK